MEKFLFLLIPIFSVVTSGTVDYSDLQALGAACPPSDTCSNITGRTFFNSNCECDNWCHAFDDCCVDAPGNLNQNAVEKRSGITCLQIEPFKGVYAIEKCSDSWNGSDVVRAKCEDEEDLIDPLMSTPAIDTRTNVTYRNHYCAECNYGSLDRLSSWNTDLTCSSLEQIDTNFHNITFDFIIQNVERSGDSWGVYHWNETLNDRIFYPCEVSFGLPENLKPHVRYCRPKIISTCSADWKRRVVQKYCLSYMAVVHINELVYRNVHCALCNRASIRNFVCGYPGLTGKKKPSLSFTLLLDVNPSDGENVGESSTCSSDETYDPFAKRCRSLVCALPGQVYRGGRCISE